MQNHRMGIVVAALILGAILGTTANAGEFKPVEQTIVSGLIVADWGQTRDIARRDDLYEKWNPILGENPSTGDVDKYFAATLVAYNVVAYYLPPKWSLRLAYAVGTVQIFAVGNNVRLGVNFDF